MIVNHLLLFTFIYLKTETCFTWR